VVFCGTIVSLSGHLEFGDRWECHLTDPVLNRRLSLDYRLAYLMDGVREGYRVPVFREGEG
jgi:hypothetical protein